MRYAKIRKMDISNGNGIGVSLFVQGCPFHCEGCFNQETWNFSGGKLWTEKTENQFLSLIYRDYIVRVSILGGEPLCDENVECVLNIIKKIKESYPNKEIWLYTGYDFNTILEKGNNPTYDNCWKYRLECVKNVDVVVDGKFDITLQDLYHEKISFAGSTNQRIIRVRDLF